MVAGYLSVYPLFVLGGLLAFVGYTAIVALGFKNGVIPTAVAVFAFASLASFLLMRSEDARAWFGVTLGVSWLVLAYAAAFRADVSPGSPSM